MSKQQNKKNTVKSFTNFYDRKKITDLFIDLPPIFHEANKILKQYGYTNITYGKILELQKRFAELNPKLILIADKNYERLSSHNNVKKLQGSDDRNYVNHFIPSNSGLNPYYFPKSNEDSFDLHPDESYLDSDNVSSDHEITAATSDNYSNTVSQESADQPSQSMIEQTTIEHADYSDPVSSMRVLNNEEIVPDESSFISSRIRQRRDQSNLSSLDLHPDESYVDSDNVSSDHEITAAASDNYSNTVSQESADQPSQSMIEQTTIEQTTIEHAHYSDPVSSMRVLNNEEIVPDESSFISSRIRQRRNQNSLSNPSTSTTPSTNSLSRETSPVNKSKSNNKRKAENFFVEIFDSPTGIDELIQLESTPSKRSDFMERRNFNTQFISPVTKNSNEIEKISSVSKTQNKIRPTSSIKQLTIHPVKTSILKPSSKETSAIDKVKDLQKHRGSNSSATIRKQLIYEEKTPSTLYEDCDLSSHTSETSEDREMIDNEDISTPNMPSTTSLLTKDRSIINNWVVNPIKNLFSSLWKFGENDSSSSSISSSVASVASVASKPLKNKSTQSSKRKKSQVRSVRKSNANFHAGKKSNRILEPNKTSLSHPNGSILKNWIVNPIKSLFSTLWKFSDDQ